jgi:hypothetical protein
MQINLPIADERDADLGAARSMTKDDFMAIFQEIKEQASGSLSETGSVPPTVFLPSMGPEGVARVGVMPVGDLVNHPVGKDVLAMLINRLIEDPNHDFVVFAHEAWVLQANAKSPEEVERLREASQRSLADHPERTEAVVITIRSKETQAFAMMPITRGADGAVTDVGSGELVFPEENGHTMEGRFAAPQKRPAGAALH